MLYTGGTLTLYMHLESDGTDVEDLDDFDDFDDF